LKADVDVVVDAIDNITAKCELLAACRSRKIKVVCSTGAGGRSDPTSIRTADLTETTMDPLAAVVRKLLRKRYGFPRKGLFNIPSVYSKEPLSKPRELHYDGGKGFSCVCPQNDNNQHSCDDRNVILGTAGYVTGAFGMACASLVVQELTRPTQV